MNIIYYSEVNLICIIILFLIYRQIKYRIKEFSTEKRVFLDLVVATIVLCTSDLIAGVYRGQFFLGARGVIEASNLIYFESMALICYLWFLNVLIKTRFVKNIRKKETLIFAIPLILFTITAIANPYTHWLFSIDENNLYSRNLGVYFHWIITWGYLIISTVLTAVAIVKEKNKIKRMELLPLLSFIIAPIIGSGIQMFFYGVTSTQVGITISVVVIFLYNQRNQILTDPLTNLNNRRCLDIYFSNFLAKHKGTSIVLLMIDIDRFKIINDKYGHMEGDRILRDIAQTLKEACKDTHRKLFICRYGGDEFLITGASRGENDIDMIRNHINSLIDRKNLEEEQEIALAVSIGGAVGICKSIDDIENLIEAADINMYQEKEKKAVKR